MIKDLTSFISGICFIILSFILFYEANQLSPFASVFPYAITSVLLLLSVLLIIRS
jgi:putative tricarboxylic transport membrane protein